MLASVPQNGTDNPNFWGLAHGLYGEYLKITISLIYIAISLHNYNIIKSGETWYIIMPRKHQKVKFELQHDKHVCQTLMLLFEMSRILDNFFLET